MKRILSLVFLVYPVTVIASGIVRPSHSHRSASAHVKAIVATFRMLPDWMGADRSELNGNDNKQSRQLRDIVSKVRRYRDDELERAMSLIVDESKRPGMDEFFPLRFVPFNRAFFQMSQRTIPDSEAYHGVIGHVNELWPLDYDMKGLLVICYPYRGYEGPVYPALREFQYLRKRYPRRKTFFADQCAGR